MASSSSSSSERAEVAELCSVGMEALTRKLGAGPVRRNLFGPVDHQQLQQDFQMLLCMSVEVAKKRWDFDFQTDRPAQGSTVEWEELKCQDVPAFYRSCVRGKRGAAPASVVVGQKADSKPAGSASPSSGSSGDEYLEVTTRGSYRIQKRTVNLRASKRRQATITDFYSVKRNRFLNHKGPSRQ